MSGLPGIAVAIYQGCRAEGVCIRQIMGAHVISNVCHLCS